MLEAAQTFGTSRTMSKLLVLLTTHWNNPSFSLFIKSAFPMRQQNALPTEDGLLKNLSGRRNNLARNPRARRFSSWAPNRFRAD
uniref:Uncharacterized protein n=1 Tax=Peronospora matthiolae TaxID=2874970 RepID=A0AAV1UE23_9STRA